MTMMSRSSLTASPWVKTAFRTPTAPMSSATRRTGTSCAPRLRTVPSGSRTGNACVARRDGQFPSERTVFDIGGGNGFVAAAMRAGGFDAAVGRTPGERARSMPSPEASIRDLRLTRRRPSATDHCRQLACSRSRTHRG